MSPNRKPFMTAAHTRRSVNPEEASAELLSVLRVIDGCGDQHALSAGKKLLQALRTLTGYENEPSIETEIYSNDNELKEDRIATLDKAAKSENLYLGRLAAQKLRELGDYTEFDSFAER